MNSFKSMLLLAFTLLSGNYASAQTNPALSPAQAAIQTTANPAYLAANCANCHGTHGQSAGAMPSLAGLKAEYIAEQMRAYRDGKRTGTIMHQLAKGYSDAQIVAIAAFFSTQKNK